MAQFTRVNGDFLPLINYDSFSYTNSGVNAVESAVTVQPAGPKLAFFTFTAAGALTTTEVLQAFQTIEQLATVMMYEYTDAGADTIAFALYPVAAWTTTSITAAMTAVGGGLAGGATTALATFTN
jgi:hypothetical protein